MNALELRVPPVLVALIFAGAMWAATRFAPALTHAVPWRAVAAAVLAVCGLVVGLLAVAAFRRAGTTVNPLRPQQSSAMVTSGIYRLSRNPMYLGVLLMLAGWAIALSNLLAAALLPVFVAYMTRFQIVPEERVLKARFGAGFDAYRAAVRRWL